MLSRETFHKCFAAETSTWTDANDAKEQNAIKLLTHHQSHGGVVRQATHRRKL